MKKINIHYVSLAPAFALTRDLVKNYAIHLLSLSPSNNKAKIRNMIEYDAVPFMIAILDELWRVPELEELIGTESLGSQILVNDGLSLEYASFIKAQISTMVLNILCIFYPFVTSDILSTWEKNLVGEEDLAIVMPSFYSENMTL